MQTDPTADFLAQLDHLQPRPPASPASVSSWERASGVSLPEEMLAFYLTLNGIQGWGDDIEIWEIERVEPLRISCPEYGSEYDSLFVFADYLIWSHGYAVSLLAERRASSPVFLVGGDAPWQVASSFGAFISEVAAGRLPQ